MRNATMTQPKRQRLGPVFLEVVIHLIVVMGAFTMILPLYWMITTSFKHTGEIMAYPPTWFPQVPTTANWKAAFDAAPWFRFFGNSLVICIAVIIGNTVFSSMAGFAFAKYRFPARDVIFMLLLSTTMIPFHVTMVPTYLMMVTFHWQDTLYALIVPGLASAFGMFLVRQYMGTIPDELLDAARIDGSPELRTFFTIIVPLAKPVLAVLALFQFVGSWNSFLWPLIIIETERKKTLPLALATFTLPFEQVNYGGLMAASTFVTAPVILVFLFSQKYMIRGIALTGMKG